MSPDLDRAVELVALDAVGEELDHLVASHLAVDDDVETRSFVFGRDQAGRVVFGLLPVVVVEAVIGILVEFFRTVQPLRLG